MGVGVGVDIGTDSIKVASVRAGASGASLLSAVRVPRPPGDTFPREALAHAMRRAGIGRSVMLGASGRDVMIRYIPVPPVPPWRLKMLVEFEIRENMAGGGADVTSDYRPLNVAGGLRQGLIVLAAVAKNAYLERSFAEARSAGLKVHASSPGAVALYRGFIASKSFKQKETTFLVDIGRENCEMAIQKDGEILFARNASGIGGEKVTAGIDTAFGIGRERAESYKRERARLTLQAPSDGDKRQMLIYSALRETGDAIVGSINSGLRFARMQTKMQDLDYDRLVLSGGGARLAGLKEFLESRLQKTVDLYDPAAALDSSRLRGAAAEAFAGAPSEMAVATGLALMHAGAGGFALSLLPPKEAARRTFWGRTVFAYAAGAAAVALAATMVVGAQTDLARTRGARLGIEAQLKELRARARAAKELQERNAATRGDLALVFGEARANRAILEFLALQRAKCPDGLSFTTLQLAPAEDARHLIVEFEGRGAMEQTAFLAKLEAFRAALVAHELVVSAEMSEAPPPPDKAGQHTRAFKCRATIAPGAASTPTQAAAGTGPAEEAQ